MIFPEKDITGSKMMLANISASGMRLEGCADLSMGATYPVQLRIANGPSLSTTAKVVWKHPDNYVHSYGMRLAALSPTEKQRLSSYIDEALGKKPPASGPWQSLVIIASALAAAKALSSLSLVGGILVITGLSLAGIYALFMRYSRP